MLADSGLFKCHACSGHLVLTLTGVLYFRTGAGPGSDRKLGRVHIPRSLPQVFSSSSVSAWDGCNSEKGSDASPAHVVFHVHGITPQ